MDADADEPAHRLRRDDLLVVRNASYSYLDRFLALDEDWRITRASRPFPFQHRGIEFACGACVAHGEKDLLVSFGIEDREAWICRVPLRSIVSSLRPLPDALPASGGE